MRTTHPAPLLRALLATCALAITAITAAHLPAQSPDTALRRVEGARERQNIPAPRMDGPILEDEMIPELFEDEYRDAGPQYVLERMRRTSNFEIFTDWQYFYTNNATNLERKPQDTGLLVGTLEVAYHPQPGWEALGGLLTPRVGFRHQIYRYGLDGGNELNNLDFDYQALYAELIYLRGDTLRATFGIEASRLISPGDDYKEFYRELMPYWSLQRAFPLGDRTALYLQYDGEIHFTETPTDFAFVAENLNDRLTNSLTATLLHQFTDKLFLQVFGRTRWEKYLENGDRDDFVSNVGAQLSWTPWDWLALRAFAQHEWRQSSDTVENDYTKVDAGVGFTLFYRF